MRAKGLWTYKDLGPGNPVVVDGPKVRAEDWNAYIAKRNAENAERARRWAEEQS